jgi:outer membrane protein assembly factor BamA
VFHTAGYLYDNNQASLFRFRNYGASATAFYPFDLFNRIEWGLSWFNVLKENIYDVNYPTISRMLFVPEAAIVHDDVLNGYYSPITGSRYNFSFRGVPKLNKTGIGFFTVTGDYRQYIMINPYMNFALRGAAGISMGPNPQRFFMGGTENWFNPTYSGGAYTMPFDQPEDFAFLQNQFLFPMRGFAISEGIGTQYFMSNTEFRFPLFRALLPGPIPIVIQNIMGSIFLDIGGIWSGDLKSFKSTKTDLDGTKKPNNLFMSTGIGIRTNMLGLPLKIDIAWSNLYYKWSMPSYLFSLGYDF